MNEELAQIWWSQLFCQDQNDNDFVFIPSKWVKIDNIAGIIDSGMFGSFRIKLTLPQELFLS